MTIHRTLQEPRNARVGDAWTDGKTFKRVLSRGRAWENVNLGSKHPDEVDHVQEQQGRRAEAQQRQQSRAHVPGLGAGQPAQDVRNDRAIAKKADDGRQQEPAEVVTDAAALVATAHPGDPFKEEGVDGNGSPVA